MNCCLIRNITRLHHNSKFYFGNVYGDARFDKKLAAIRTTQNAPEN